MPAARVSLGDIKIPVYNLASREDHIAPARSVFLGSQYFGGTVEYVMAGSGHIAGVVNPPQSKKYQYWTGGKPVGDFDDWIAKATENPGSWWPHWQKWIEDKDDTACRGAQARQEDEDARRCAGRLCEGPSVTLLVNVTRETIDSGRLTRGKAGEMVAATHDVASFRP